MRWEDERYIRIYTRDTPDWLALGWEAQALLVLTLRKTDRAGMLDLGRAGYRGLAALVGMPAEVVERALPILLADGCMEMSGSILVAPNFIEAQETAQSDRQRKAESRAKARDRAHLKSQNVTEPLSQNVTEPLSQNVTETEDQSQNVTFGHENGQKVTRGHAASHAVTDGHPLPCRAVPCCTDPTDPCSSISTTPDTPPPNGSLAACLLEKIEADQPQHPPAVSATPESGAEKTEAPSGAPASAPEPDGTSPARAAPLGLPSREEVRDGMWPLTERFAHQLGELRGLTECPLSWPRRENRDRFEWLLSRVGVAWAAEAAWSNWREAISRGENVTSLGFFLRLLELRAASPPPEPRPLSDCEPWAQILAKYAENGGRETAKWLRLYVKPSIGDGKLFLAVEDEFSGAYVLRHLGEIESEAKKRGLDVELVAPTSPQATSEVSP